MRKEDKEALCDDFDGFRVDYANISYMSVTATLDYLSEMTRVMRALGYGPEDVGSEDIQRSKAAKRYSRLHDKVAKDCQRFFNSLATLHSFSAQVKRKVARGRASLKSENRYVSLSEWRSLAEKLGEFDDSEAMIEAILSVYDLNDPSRIDALPEKERDFVREFAASLKPEPRKAEKSEGAESKPKQSPEIEEPPMIASENIPLSDDDAPVFDNEPAGEVSFENEIELEPVNCEDIEESAPDDPDEELSQKADPGEEVLESADEDDREAEIDEDDLGDPDESDVDIDEDDPDEDDIEEIKNAEDSFENPDVETDEDDIEAVDIDIDDVETGAELSKKNEGSDAEADADFDESFEINLEETFETLDAMENADDDEEDGEKGDGEDSETDSADEDDENWSESDRPDSEGIVFQDDEDPDFSAQVDAAYEALDDDGDDEDDDEDDDDWEEQ